MASSNDVAVMRHKNTESSSGVSSDLSDSDNEDNHHHHHHVDGNEEVKDKSKALEESGIFVNVFGKSIVDIGTQTGKLQTAVKPAADGSKTPGGGGGSDYESCEELEDLREECKGLVHRKNSLEDEIEGYKGEIQTLKTKLENDAISDQIVQLKRLEFSLRNQLKEWESKYNTLQKENALLLEEKCELEEAENDSRLNAQRWDHQYRLVADENKLLNSDLDVERKTTTILQSELTDAQEREVEAKAEVAHLESLVQRYEQRIFDLEEVEVELRDKLILLEQACNVVSWINERIGGGGVDKVAVFKALPMMSDEAMNGKEKKIEELEERLRELNESARLERDRHVEEIRALQNRLQDDLQRRAADVEAKEAAYSQTIQEADSILCKVQGDYEATIETLKEELMEMKAKVERYQKRESDVESDLIYLKKAPNCGAAEQNSKIAELMARLMEAEKKEADLKDRLFDLERGERELGLKLIDAERENAELKDAGNSDEVNLKMSVELDRLRSRMKRDESRIDELESIESSLKTELTSRERISSEREKNLKLKLRELSSELEAKSEALNEASAELTRANRVRVEVESRLGSELDEAGRRLSYAEQNMTSYRSEVRERER